MKKNNKPVKLGWVGVRGYGARLWNSVKDVSSCTITACYHPDRHVSENAAERMGCRSFTDLAQLFSCPEIDAVVLTIPNEFHFRYTKKALEAGKHVLVEKPLTNTLAEAEALEKSASAASLVLMVGHNYRKNDFIVTMKNALDGGRIGKPVAAEFNMGHGGGLKFTPKQWRFHREKCPGGPLNMLGIHLIDAANYFFGKVNRISGIVKNLYADTTAEDTSLIQLEYQNGVVVNITTLYNSVSTEFINIYGTDGALRFSRWPAAALWYQPHDVGCDCAPYEKLVFKENDSAREIFEDFIKVINGEEGISANTQEAVQAVRIIETILQAQKARRQ